MVGLKLVYVAQQEPVAVGRPVEEVAAADAGGGWAVGGGGDELGNEVVVAVILLDEVGSAGGSVQAVGFAGGGFGLADQGAGGGGGLEGVAVAAQRVGQGTGLTFTQTLL